jgi:hypothetical protein
MSRRFFIVQWYPRIKSVASNTACYAVSCLNDSILKFGKLLSDGLMVPLSCCSLYLGSFLALKKATLSRLLAWMPIIGD